MTSFKADHVTVSATMEKDGQYDPHPEGTFLARCVDVIDLGDKVEQFEGNPKKLVPKLALVFVTGEIKDFNGQAELIPLTKEFSKTFGDKANLRKFAESWRGKSYKPAELATPIDFGKMAGVFAQISVEHKVSRAGRTFANIASIAPVMKGTPLPEHLGAEYERPKYLTDKKAAYAAEAAKFREEIGATAALAGDFRTPPRAAREDDGSSLPF